MNGHDDNTGPAGGSHGSSRGSTRSARRRVEASTSALQSGIQGIDTRLAAIEERLKHLPTRECVVAGVVGGSLASALVTVAILELFKL